MVENSKEEFRQAGACERPDLLLDHQRFEERKVMPQSMRSTVVNPVGNLSIGGRAHHGLFEFPDRPLESMMAVLGDELGLAR